MPRLLLRDEDEVEASEEDSLLRFSSILEILELGVEGKLMDLVWNEEEAIAVGNVCILLQ